MDIQLLLLSMTEVGLSICYLWYACEKKTFFSKVACFIENRITNGSERLSELKRFSFAFFGRLGAGLFSVA